MRAALFADIHGKILLPFKLVDLYQRETGNTIDVILQCGDIGAYPTINNLDKATLKHARNDRDELGFHDDFVTEDTAIRAYLDKLNIDMICVRGNHEDHDFLDALEQQNNQLPRYPIDVYKRIYVCRSGVRQSVTLHQETLTFAGIGRIGDRKGRTEKRFIQDYERKEITRLSRTNDVFDILLTHDKDDNSQRGYGMAEIRELLDRVIFRYHFHGHTGEPFSDVCNGIIRQVKIKELEFEDSGILPKACMVILEKQDSELHLDVVEQRLTNTLTKYNWKLWE